jgi:hypothetical protein
MRRGHRPGQVASARHADLRGGGAGLCGTRGNGAGAKGTSTLRFSARVGGHALTPGSYALRATPARGKSRSTSFRIVR